MIKNEEIKLLYNRSVNKKYLGDYEFNRWFTTQSRRTDFFMTYSAIKLRLENINFERCLELGPGPGTWTRMLFRKNPKAFFDLVDISIEMQHQFQLEMRGGENIQYFVKDIMNFKPNNKYDLFFSSRAIEYLANKKSFFNKLYKWMNFNSRGILITKNPKFGFRKKKIIPKQHTGQINQEKIRKVLSEAGFSEIKIYPVIVRIPILNRLGTYFPEKLFKKIYTREISNNLMSKLFESYLVTFTKKHI